MKLKLVESVKPQPNVTAIRPDEEIEGHTEIGHITDIEEHVRKFASYSDQQSAGGKYIKLKVVGATKIDTDDIVDKQIRSLCRKLGIPNVIAQKDCSVREAVSQAISEVDKHQVFTGDFYLLAKSYEGFHKKEFTSHLLFVPEDAGKLTINFDTGYSFNDLLLNGEIQPFAGESLFGYLTAPREETIFKKVGSATAHKYALGPFVILRDSKD